MRKILFLIAMLPVFISAQNKFFNADGINKLKSVIGLAKLEASTNSTQTIFEAQQKFTNKIDTAQNVNPILKINKEYISNLYSEMYQGSGKNDLNFADSSWKPEIFAYNTGNAILFNTIIYSSVFNNRILDKRQRAKRIVEDIANLIYQRISTKINTKIPYIGLCIAYCDKDFGEKYETAKADCIIVVAPSSAIKSYGDCQISEDEFCKKCDYYLSDKDEFMGLRKIDLKIYD
ncbi:hypothetical protein [Bacteroides graminisolvens]